MKCWFCENEARGTCAFCGRATCKEHVKEGKTKVEAAELSQSGKLFYKISNAIKCSACKVKYERSTLSPGYNY